MAVGQLRTDGQIRTEMTKLQKISTEARITTKIMVTASNEGLDQVEELLESLTADNLKRLRAAGLSKKEALAICKAEPRFYAGLPLNNQNPTE